MAIFVMLSLSQQLDRILKQKNYYYSEIKIKNESRINTVVRVFASQVLISF